MVFGYSFELAKTWSDWRGLSFELHSESCAHEKESSMTHTRDPASSFLRSLVSMSQSEPELDIIVGMTGTLALPEPRRSSVAKYT